MRPRRPDQIVVVHLRHMAESDTSEGVELPTGSQCTRETEGNTDGPT